MNSVHQIRSAVANIQDELLRILASAEVRPIEQNHVAGEFKTKLIAEFNTKLRGFKSKIRTLNEENAQLRERILQLESQLTGKSNGVRTTKSIGNLHQGPEMAPPKRQRTSPEEERVEIISSPIKQTTQVHSIAALSSKPDLTSSQLNRLPTQYSDTNESMKESIDVFARNTQIEPQDRAAKSPERSSKGSHLSSSPVKATFIEEDDRIVADSQDEFEALGADRRLGHPSHYTALQRIEFLRNYYRMKLSDTKYSVDLSSNPITEKPWVLADFKPNMNWSRPKHLHSHIGVMTKAQEKIYDRFFQEAGHGVKMAGPQWDAHQPLDQVAHGDNYREYNNNDDNDDDEDNNINIKNINHINHININNINNIKNINNSNNNKSNNHNNSSDSEKENSQHSQHKWIRSQVMDKYLSPPGFMVALFPTTQQEQERKQLVAEKNRERVQRRVTSALTNGEFVFYEEVLNTYVAQGRYTR